MILDLIARVLCGRRRTRTLTLAQRTRAAQILAEADRMTNLARQEMTR